jgi:hypothetical protein
MCNLEDMGYIGDIFTWRRGRMRERLDRAVCDPRWSAMFPLVGVVNEDFGKSDHRPILINTEYNAGMHAIPQRGPLRFEARWLCEESVENIIQTSWERAKQLHAGSALSDHTEDVHKALHRWDKEVLKGPRRRLRELQKELNIVMSGELSDEAVAKQKEIQMSIENLLEQEELYWVQRGRVNWLKHGDQNTAFFHRSATARRKRNFIKSLKTESGDVVEDSDQLMSLATGYFQNLFSTDVQNPDQGVFDKVIPRVTEDMNQILLAPYTREEVKKALFNIGDLKAPGPDGLHAVFYKRFWHIIGEDLTDEVLIAVNSRTIPEGWNNTTVVLIPKVENPEFVTQFRPISLCNVIYKVISKLIANRLKRLLPEIISPTQSAFVPGRLITDNLLVAYECYHSIKNKKTGKYGTCAVKLDMHKAYDRVEWCFLEKILVRLGFDTGWVGLIMACVSSVRYQLRLNNVLSDYIYPSRGLRQGDPLSPYLFLLCAEGLSSLLNFEETAGNLIGVKVCRDAPSVSHLLFADDSLILMRADETNATSLCRALDDYCVASGQLVSEAKSSIFFQSMYGRGNPCGGMLNL